MAGLIRGVSEHSSTGQGGFSESEYTRSDSFHDDPQDYWFVVTEEICTVR
jgi:hypothetical protein